MWAFRHVETYTQAHTQLNPAETIHIYAKPLNQHIYKCARTTNFKTCLTCRGFFFCCLFFQWRHLKWQAGPRSLPTEIGMMKKTESWSKAVFIACWRLWGRCSWCSRGGCHPGNAIGPVRHRGADFHLVWNQCTSVDFISQWGLRLCGEEEWDQCLR